ncbi:MAG: diacylglycerol kinase family protein [Candidatus Saccharimonadales bacterium]
MTYTYVAIIYNPHSTGNSKRNATRLEKQLRSSKPNITIERIPTEYAGHARELAYQIAKKYKRPLIVSSSGDGGYNEVINGVMQAKNPDAICAVLPSGNANDHSRAMKGRPLAEGIVAGTVTQIDLLKLVVGKGIKKPEVYYAHSYIGLGVSPIVATELNSKKLNMLSEIALAVRMFVKYDSFTIVQRGQKRRYNSLIFANIRQMAKVLKFSKDNRPADGLFEVVELPHTRKYLILLELIKAATVGLNTTRHESKYVFKTVQDMPFQLDGEVIDITAGSKVKVLCADNVLKTVV